MKKLSLFCVFLFLGCLFFSGTASAYIDPSAMTYIVQIIVGIVIAGGAAFAFYFRKIKRKLRKKDEGTENYDKRVVHTAISPEEDEFDAKNLKDDDFDTYDKKN